MEDNKENSVSKVKTPLIIDSEKISSWQCMRWTLNDWAIKSGLVLFSFRIHKKNSMFIWENEAIDRFVTSLSYFSEWLRCDAVNCTPLNPFRKYPKAEYWAYSSYNYMSQLFDSEKNQEIIDSINWSDIGIDDKLDNNAINSSLWIGSNGAFTPCHYDTYGYNLVAQLSGKKLWVLFPPSDSKFLYPTRIPYEESSVFSSVNIRRPNLEIHSKFRYTSPHIVELKAGQILLVPHHWWHYVEVIEEADDGSCFSVNTWLADNCYENSLHESIVRLLTTSLFATYQTPEHSHWINTGTNLFTQHEAIDMVTLMVNECKLASYSKESVSLDEIILPENSQLVKPSTYFQFRQLFDNDSDKCNEKYDEKYKENCDKCNDRRVSIESIINCILQPDVIELIAEKLKNI